MMEVMPNECINDLEIVEDTAHIKIAEIGTDKIIAEFDSPMSSLRVNDAVDETVFVVTYWDNGLEPVVTVFDNRENAEKCYSFFIKRHSGCCVDEVPVYKHFGETGE